jgi:adenosylmethionine-8-amino-7-oxononanoate aminotransferase
MTSNYLKNLDLKNIWHPCTQMKDHEFLPLIPIKRGKGIYLYDFDDNCYIDAISSWWVNLFGHSNSYINSKIKEQLESLEHVILAGFSHKPAIDLASKLVSITPDGLNKVFYADNGSSAIEVALKMSYHYFKNIGINKDTFLSLTNSYHGETLGALSVGDVTLYKDTYEPLLIKNMQTPVPTDKSINASNIALEKLEDILKKHHSNIAALIVEPLIQGAGNMHMYHPSYLIGARELTKKYNIHLIADEIMTGFGRSGEMFACELANITPDFMTLSKGLTGGYLPLSTVLTTNTIYNAFYCDYNEHKAFLHSHSYTGNPLACSAALATLEIFENDNVINNNKIKSKYIEKKLQIFNSLPNVENIRQTGMVAAFDIKGYKAEDRIGLQVYTYSLKHGVILRPLGNTIYFMPPYIINNKEIDKMIEVAYEAVAKLL